MKKLPSVLIAFLLVFIGLFTVVPTVSVAAEPAGSIGSVCASNNANGDNPICARNNSQTTGSFVGTLVNVLLFVVGGLSVIMIIVGALLYVTSQGDTSSVTKAKNTILYAVIGLVISILAYAIVNWVFHLF